MWNNTLGFISGFYYCSEYVEFVVNVEDVGKGRVCMNIDVFIVDPIRLCSSFVCVSIVTNVQ